MRKWLIIIIVIVVLIAAFVLRMGANQRKGQREEVTSVIPVEVIPVTRGKVVSTCEVLGTIMSDKTAQVFPETIGRIMRVLVKEGSYVKKDANIMAMRNETVGFEYEEGFIKSPINGNVGKIMVDVGSMVSPQAPVAMIVDYYRVKVEFHVAEVNMGCVNRNQRVAIVVDGIDQDFTARVSEISPVIDPMTRTAAVKAVNLKKSSSTFLSLCLFLSRDVSSEVLTNIIIVSYPIDSISPFLLMSAPGLVDVVSTTKGNIELRKRTSWFLLRVFTLSPIDAQSFIHCSL